jgi:hypothetical protein
MNIIKKITAVILLICLCVLLFSCGGNRKNGIEILDTDAPFSAQTETAAKETFYSILKGAYSKGGAGNISSSKDLELRTLSEKIYAISSEQGISERQYKELLYDIEQNEESFISVFTGGGQDAYRTVYRTLALSANANYAGRTLYRLIIFALDYEYEAEMERYEKYGYSYLLTEANAIKEKRDKLSETIGEDNFSAVARIGITASELFFGGAFDGGILSGFSSREILVLLRRIDIDGISLDTEGYEFLISLAVPQSNDAESEISDRILYTAKENSHIASAAKSAEEFMNLLLLLQSSLTEADAALIKNAQWEALITSLFSHLDDEGWQSFERAVSGGVDFSPYETLFSEHYGQDFADYSDMGWESFDIDTLRTSVGEADFLEKLEGYLAGISPVLSYRLFK